MLAPKAYPEEELTHTPKLKISRFLHILSKIEQVYLEEEVSES